jgi:glutathione synthase/RimK-type ligase-like ATP-grasp enzyme
LRLTRTRRYMLARSAVKRVSPRRFPEHGPIDDAAAIEDAEQVLIEWPEDVRKPRVALVRDIDDHPYWTKYRRFLTANDIPFEIYDIHRSSWLREAQRFDMVVWRPSSYPYELAECRRKFHILESRLGLLCYPSFAEAQLYEDKVAQYELLRYHDLPVIDTFVSDSEQETAEYLASCDYPLVWKLTAGSGSLGVELVRTRRTAERWARRVFDFAGRRTYWPYVGQKNYVYLQDFIHGAGYDLRVIVVGAMVFGYFRDVPDGEYRASGMNVLRWDPPPPAAMRLARRVADVLDLSFVAVDMLADAASGALRIIEISSFIGVETPAQLRPGGVPGAYIFEGPGDEHSFVPMRVWVQELALRHVLETRWLARERQDGGGPRP